MNLDLSALEKAIESLEKGMKRACGAPADEELRDAVIQRFEYTYELCWKMIKRRVETDAAVPSDVDALSFQALMREAGERGLVEEVSRWMEYREQRNITSHVYNQKKAASVFQTARVFLPDARALLVELKRRNND